MELLILNGFLVPIALLGSQLSSAFLAPRRVAVAKDKETFKPSHEKPSNLPMKAGFKNQQNDGCRTSDL
jgi:hypothetical protein